MQMLRMGSSGPAVASLQKALNLAGNTSYPNLVADGRFGPRTHGRVMDFQRKNRLMPDGIVGPNTYKVLEQYFELLDKVIGELPSPPDEAAARQRVVATATQFQRVHGWRPTDVVGPTNHRIAANRCADPASRTRQGGVALSTVWSVAGVANPPPPRCLTISKTAETNYANGAKGRNEWDLISW